LKNSFSLPVGLIFFFGEQFMPQNKESYKKREFTIPSDRTTKEFGKINIHQDGQETQVEITILMEPQGEGAEGWQTGVALDASASMKDLFGQMKKGKIPAEVEAVYAQKKWVKMCVKDGREVKIYEKEALDDASKKGYLQSTPNIIEPLAQNFIAYLAGNLDADGGTTVLYWACGDGSQIEVLGDFTEAQCRTLKIIGPTHAGFGQDTMLTPAVTYFVDRFKDAERGMYVFLTDGEIHDLNKVTAYTIKLCKEIEGGKRNPVKCVLIGVGDGIDEKQMEELDNLDSGTHVDIWDHKIAKDMRSLVEIFAEVVSDNHIIAPTARVYGANGQILKQFSDGLPARISFTMPSSNEWFELEVGGNRIRQVVLMPPE
jgi:hypothetical protein